MPYQNLTLPTLILTSKIPSRNYSLLFHNFEVIVETFGLFTPEGALAKPEIPEKMPWTHRPTSSGSLVQKHSQQDFGMPCIIIQFSSPYNAHPEERLSQISLSFDFFLKIEIRKGTVQSFGPQRYATGYVKPKRHARSCYSQQKTRWKSTNSWTAFFTRRCCSPGSLTSHTLREGHP